MTTVSMNEGINQSMYDVTNQRLTILAGIIPSSSSLSLFYCLSLTVYHYFPYTFSTHPLHSYPPTRLSCLLGPPIVTSSHGSSDEHWLLVLLSFTPSPGSSRRKHLHIICKWDVIRCRRSYEMTWWKECKIVKEAWSLRWHLDCCRMSEPGRRR